METIHKSANCNSIVYCEYFTVINRDSDFTTIV